MKHEMILAFSPDTPDEKEPRKSPATSRQPSAVPSGTAAFAGHPGLVERFHVLAMAIARTSSGDD